ncbi:MAG: HAD family acid phosphatase, partial [Paracoccaceae bacterium]
MKLTRNFIAGAAITMAMAMPVSAQEFPKIEVLPDQMILPTAWVQSSAEYEALTISIYNMAKVILDMHLSMANEKPPAVILDLDETLLDNSPYQA